MICSYFYSVYEKEVDYRFMIVFILFGLIYVCLFFYGLFVIYLKGWYFYSVKIYMIIEVMKNLFCGLL